MVGGWEYCPHCGSESEFCVDEGVWVAVCNHCGHPIVLCDKCRTMNGSGNTANCPACVHERRCAKLSEAWERIFGRVRTAKEGI